MQFFELSVALKYLTPRWRQLSVSIISLISILVISLVVWLIVVFFSVTHGLEKNWVQKLIALTAPIRITPTEQYYDSYYYQIDGISSASDYAVKTIGEKQLSVNTDPYDPVYDEEIPYTWPAPKLDEAGNLIDPVKLAFEAIEQIPNVDPHEYAMTYGTLKLRLLRDNPMYSYQQNSGESRHIQSFIKQNIYLASFDPLNKSTVKAIIRPSADDVKNILNALTLSSDNLQFDTPDEVLRLDAANASEQLQAFFEIASINTLQTPSQGWRIPSYLMPSSCTLDACVTIRGEEIGKIFIPASSEDLVALSERLKPLGEPIANAKLQFDEGKASAVFSNHTIPIAPNTPLYLEGDATIQAQIDKDSLANAKQDKDIIFDVSVPVQDNTLSGKVPYEGLEVADAKLQTSFSDSSSSLPLWIHTVKDENGKQMPTLPIDQDRGDGILLPKGFRDAGVLIGDQGYLSYVTATASSMQEQRIPVSVAGFFDPGIVPLGNKIVLTTPEVTSLMRSAQNQSDTTLNNGINIHFDDLSRAESIKNQLQQSFDKAGIGEYWKIETYREYEHTKDILQQLESEKNLFSLLAIVIIIVACSNIISMLIILVNDKKQEIGILRSMGASSFSITCIFGTCGVVMGLIGSAIGIALAVVTLQNLQSLVGMLSKLQGHDMFNPAFYGERLPTDLSGEALAFVIIMTAVISTIAGIVPAIKACMMRPSEILRDE